jgi:mannosyltransferase OCH1-like enzyme
MCEDLHNPEYVKSICKYIGNKGIPKIIHQIWINENNLTLPEDWRKGSEEWKRWHPDYIYILWDKDSSLNFVEKYFPSYLSLYINMPYTIQRCDLIRYMFLHKFGGIYSDMDNYPVENLEKWIGDKDAYFVEMNIFYKTINNNLIFAKRDLTLFLNILDYISQMQKYKKFVLTKTLRVGISNGISYINKRLKKDKSIAKLPYQRFNPHSLVDEKKYYKEGEVSIMSSKGGMWHEKDMIIFLFFYKNFIFILFFIFIIFIIIYVFFFSSSQDVKNFIT